MKKAICILSIFFMGFTVDIGGSRVTDNTGTMHGYMSDTGLSLYEYSDSFPTADHPYFGSWTACNGEFDIESETLYHEQSISGMSFALLNQAKQFVDGTIQVEVKTGSIYERGGIAFRIQDFNNYYYFSVCPNADNPDVQLKKVVDGSASQLGTGVNSYNDTATFYTFKVVVSGSSIKTYIDDNLINDVTDTTFSAGYVGLVSQRASGAGSFDDFSISMTYTNDTQSGLIEDNSDTLSDFSYSGWDRCFGENDAVYLCGRSGMVSTIYYEQDATLDISKTNCSIGSTGNYIALSDAQGTAVGGNVSSYTLTYPMLVLAGASYEMDVQTDDSSWAMWGIVDESCQTGHNSRSEIDYVGINTDTAKTYDITANRKLKLWAS